MKIVTNKNKLRIPTQPCETVDEGIKIGNQLIEVLNRVGGIGLSANQVGINKSVCVVSSRKDEPPKILINPKCVGSSNEMVSYLEGCLSLPGKTVKTVRNKNVTISCDNWENEIEFGPSSENLTQENFWQDEGLLECVCVQHEMGHLNGELITDAGVRLVKEPKRSNKIGRNDKVMIKKDDKTQFLKYKKAQNLLDAGWEII